MSTDKRIDKICLAAVLAAVLLALAFLNGQALGLQSAERTMGYESLLFDASKVHTIEIVMDDWEGFLETCENEEYAVCSVVIDGEAVKNVGLRAKGNTSLSTVSQMGSDRYSFKIEFDQYDSTKTYHGLDKLCLNNLIQDATMMKDYLAYTLMGEFGVASPLTSYAFLTVNGEDWGLYLAVEAIEESFLQRNYGADYGELYKPDSMSFGGGRGNGRDFDMDDFMKDLEEAGNGGQFEMPEDGQFEMPEDGQFEMPEDGQFEMPEDGQFEMPEDGQFEMPEDGQFEMPEDGQFEMPEDGRGGMGGMGSDDVKLQYIDDDPDSYSNIFSSAKTAVSEADEARLISSLRSLSSYEDLEDVLDTDAVLRYFVVHNFLVNGDSYTGDMIHNYYLYEEDGRLSMLPWDYNLAFGTFQGGDASSAVNDPIDDQLDDRPMQGWIFSDEEYVRRYHELYQEFLSSVDLEALVDETAALIAPYVERDPTAFYTAEEFEAGVEALKTFCSLRALSVQGQLDGTVPSTSEAQRQDSGALVDTDGLDLSDMGSMGGGGGMDGGRGGMDGRPDRQTPDRNGSGQTAPAGSDTEAPDGGVQESGRETPDRAGGAPEDEGTRTSFPDAGDPSAGTAGPGAETPAAGWNAAEMSARSGGTSAPQMLWLLASVLVLAAGLLFALCYRRRGRPRRRTRG